MADVTITNLTTSPLYIGDLYATIPASSSIVVSRYASDLPRMKALQDAITAGNAAVSVALTASETASGLAQASGTIQAQDVAPVAATDAAAAEFTLTKAFTALGAGVPDDVVIYAVNTLPFKVRVLSAQARVSTAIALSTINVYDQAAGAGQLCAALSSATTGIVPMTGPNASVVVTPGALIGLFVHRSDRGVAGEVVITCRREV